MPHVQQLRTSLRIQTSRFALPIPSSIRIPANSTGALIARMTGLPGDSNGTLMFLAGKRWERGVRESRFEKEPWDERTWGDA